MKSLISIIALLLPLLGFSQNHADSLVKKYKLNFAMPDFPAFKSLGTEPSNLLRPSSIKDFGFVSSEFFNGGSLTIPGSFAVEICPILFTNVNTLTLSQYQKNNAWKSSRFSIGATRDSLNTSKLSVGYRISLINKGDLRTDTKAIKSLNSRLMEQSKTRSLLRNQFLIEHEILPFDITDSIELLVDLYIENKIAVKNAQFALEVKEFKIRYKDEHWNAEKLDVAIAVVGQSPDTLLENIGYSSLSFWATYARPLFKGTSSQFLIGLYYQNYLLNAKNFSTLSISNRNYMGSNRAKVFIEEQVAYGSLTEGVSLLLNIGAEVNIKDGIWLDFSAGTTRNVAENSSKLVSQIRFRYTLPEK